MVEQLGDNWIDCSNQPIDLETALKGLFVYNEASGKYAVNFDLLTSLNCTDWVPASVCASEVSLITMLLGAIALDDCGNPALRMVHNTAAPQ